jgi:peptide/nickel transport system permease protein
MLRFLIRRTIFGVVVMWIVATIVFAMYFIAPHNVARTLAGKQASAATVAAISHTLGLDRPVLVQYGSFLWRSLHGNLGYSYANFEPVTTLIGQALPVTASLVAGGAIIWLILGVSAGVLASTRPRSLIDRSTTGLALFFYSMPTFLLGEVLLLVLFFRLHLLGIDWFPGAGYVPLDQDPLQWARYLILPWLTIALVTAATYVRLTRGSMLDVMGEDYIRTARAKGIRESRVVYRHGLRAALTPVLTQFGIDVGTLLGGAIVTENVFGLPGLVLLASAFVVVANIVVDILYSLLDVRVRLS